MDPKLTRAVPISDEAVIKALQLRCSQVYPALALANAFAGADTDEWWLVHNHSLPELLAEADRRQITLDQISGCMPDIDPPLLVNCPRYANARAVFGRETVKLHDATEKN